MRSLASNKSFFAGRRDLVIILIIVAAVFTVYMNALVAEFVYDDGMYIVKNPQIRHLSNFVHIPWNRYLTFLSFALNYAISGYVAFDFRLVNVIIHALNAILVFYFVKLTIEVMRGAGTGDERGSGIWPAFVAALIFAVHPIETQAVTYVAQRFVSLATLFYLLTLVYYIKFRIAGAHEGRSGAHRIYFAIAFISAVLAQLCKEIAFTLPAVIALYEFTFFDGKIDSETGRTDIKKRIFGVLPFALVFVVIPLTMLVPNEASIAEKIRIAQVNELINLSRHDYLATQFRVIVTYLRLLVYPANQQLLYDYPVYRSFFNANVAASFALLVCLFAGAVYLLVRSVKRNNDNTRLIAFGILWFFITISVESSIVPIKHVIFEHRVYLPSIGIFVVFSLLLFLFFDYMKSKKASPRNFNGFALLTALTIAIVLGVASMKRNSVWLTGLSLWQDTIEKAPDMNVGYENTAYHYRINKQYDKALEFYMKAANRTPPEDFFHYLDMISGVLISLERYEEAITLSRQAIELYPDKGTLYLNLGVAYSKLGKKDMAIGEFKKAIKVQPDFIFAYKNIAIALYDLGRYDEALVYVERALSIDPYSEDILLNYARLLNVKGRKNDAQVQYAKVKWINPNIDIESIRKSDGEM